MQRLEAGAAQIIMEEKRAHKVRKSGGGRKKRKPDYDAGKNLKEQMESAVALYNPKTQTILHYQRIFRNTAVLN